jgi:4-diphosphocytidyl-2-C-methyl-D-erythritol kinase
MAQAQEIRVFAPAKVNLFLELIRKRPDGYHDLETLMASVDLCDEIAIGPANEESPQELSFTSGWIVEPDLRHTMADAAFGVLPPADKNLAFRAIELLRRECRVTSGAVISLSKRIPAEAGLGGASSDAAAALIAGNAFWKLQLSADQLSGLAAQLGSDVPFFLQGGWALCRGRGEIVVPQEGLPPIWVVILRPPFGLSTPKVYAQCQIPAKQQSVEELLSALRNRDEKALSLQLQNRLWPAAVVIEPRLAEFPEIFRSAGLLAHQMSGSGSSYFGVTFDRGKAIAAATFLRSRQLGYIGLGKGGTKNACIQSADTLSS